MLSEVGMILLTFFLLSELSRTTGFTDIPTAPQSDLRGILSVGLVYSLPAYNSDPNPNDDLTVDPNDYDVVLKYGFGRGEIALSMFTLDTYAAHVKYLLVKERKQMPAVFAGIDDISYSPYISTIGRGNDVGFLEEKAYYLRKGGRPWELLSSYVALQKTIPPFMNLVFGIGRGRFVGYGQRSHIYNTDLIALGDEYLTRIHSSWAIGIFIGGSIKFPFGLEMMLEMDGRDANAGIKYNHKYFTTTFAITKLEHFINSGRPYSPRLTFGLEANDRFRFEGPRIGSIECIVQDVTSKELLGNSIVDIKEVNKRYNAIGGTFNMSLPAGTYTITVSKTNYVDYVTKITLKPNIKSTLVFNLKKTEEALRRETALREKEKTIKNYLEQGKIYFLENKLDPAKISFGMVISLDPGNTEAKEYLAQIEPKRLELTAAYTEEAKTRTGAGDFAKAIETWQKVLSLDPTSDIARSAISDLQSRILAAKPPEPKKVEPTKPKITEAEIEALYKKGVSLFTAEKYDDALKIFKQVLAQNPSHAGAKDYKNRTEARIKALGGG